MSEKIIVSRNIYPQSRLLGETLTRNNPDITIHIQANEDDWDTIVARRDLPNGAIQLEGIRIRPISQELLQKLFTG